MRAFRPQEEFTSLGGLAFSPDSKWLASCAAWTAPHLWPLEAGLGGDRLLDGPICYTAKFHPRGDRLLLGGRDQPISVLPAAGGKARYLGPTARGQTLAVAFDGTGRLVAAAPLDSPETDRVLRVWDLDSGEVATMDLLEDCQEPEEQNENVCGVWDLRFAPDGAIYTSGHKGIRRWDIDSGRATWIYGVQGSTTGFDLTPDGRFLVAAELQPPFALVQLDLNDGSHRPMEGHALATSVALDSTGEIIASGAVNGAIRVGLVSGGEPHLLLGHTGFVRSLAISADGRWVAASTSEEIRLWPMPDLSKPPFHTLPQQELLAKLYGLTNLQVIEDPASESGWNLEVGPFPGWQEVPEW